MLDMERFAKVWALANRGATEGERAAGRSRAEAMASSAGLSLADAVARLFDSAPMRPDNPFYAFFHSPEKRAEMAERARRDAIKRDRVLREYGSVRALFDRTPWEIALRKAVESFSIIMPYACISGVERTYVAVMDGEISGDCIEGTDRAKEAIAAAYPMPISIGAAMEEVKQWNKLRWDRGLFHHYGYNPDAEVLVRNAMIEKFLEVVPVCNWQDMEDRFAWKRYEWESQWLEPQERDDPFMDRLQEDFRILRAKFEAATEQRVSPHSGVRSMKSKRKSPDPAQADLFSDEAMEAR